MKHTVYEATLSNGAKGLFVYVPDASVMTYEISFRAGDYLVKKKKWETPHLMEHVLLGANEKFSSSLAFQAELEKNGAYANASTGSYDITYEAECADFEWDRVLELLLTAITKPLFKKSEFEAEVGNVREELFARSNNHFRHLNLALRNKYGFYVLPDHERVELMDNVNLDDVIEHYKKTHTSKNLRFVFAGNITPDRQKTIEHLISTIDLPKGKTRFELPDEVPKTLGKALYIDNPTVENLYFYIDSFTKKRVDDASADALSMANILLTETFYSKIFGKARRKGLVYGISSSHSRMVHSTNFWLGAQVMPKNFNALIDLILLEIGKLKKGILKQSDIDAAKLFALGRYQRGAQTVYSTANIYSGRYFYDGNIEAYFEMPARIQAVNKNIIVKVINEVFSGEVKGFGMLGSCKQPYADEQYKRIQTLWLA